ncbi:MAG: hypothetical protein RLY21_2523 [Planctomycetota bacterium]|jgi:hypothetical protein
MDCPWRFPDAEPSFAAWLRISENRWKSHASGETERHPLHNSRERVIQVVGGCGGYASGGRQRKESGQVKGEQSLNFGMSATVIWHVQRNTRVWCVKFPLVANSRIVIGHSDGRIGRRGGAVWRG